MPRETKSVLIPVRFTPSDKVAIEKAAVAEEMSSSEYVRSAVLAYMALRMDRHALQSALRGGMELLKEFEAEGRASLMAVTKRLKA